MRKNFHKKTFITFSLILFVFFPVQFCATAQDAKFLDIVGEITYGEECLKTWQIEEASSVANKLLLLAPNDPYVCFLTGEVRFYEGNYQESLLFLKKALNEPAIAQKGEELYNLVDKIYQTTGKFKEVRTEHFLFRYVEEKDVILVDYAIKALEKAYNSIGNDLNYLLQAPILVEVYPDAESFCTISTLTKEEIETSGTVAICLFNRVIITSPRLQPRGYQWLDTLAHEFVHYVIMKKTYNRVPIWLHEGIAKYEEKRWIEDNTPNLPVSLVEFEKNWLNELKQKKLRRIHGIRILPTKLKESSAIVDDLESVAEIEVKDARKYAILGDLLRREGLHSTAIVEYEKAFNKAGNISPQIQNKLAMAYILDTQYAKAEEILKVALEYYPEYTTTYISLGELYQRKGDYDIAIQLLSEANHINPFNSVIHKNLAMLFDKLCKKDEASIEVKRLRMLVK